MKLSHLNALRALEVSVRHGSFRAAAEELNVSPAAIGKHVKTLEEVTGSELLKRTPNGFVVTALARQAASELTRGFDRISVALEIIAQNSDPSRLSISIVPTIAEYWLAPRLPAFWQANPGIKISLDSTSTLLDPDLNQIDFSLRYAPDAAIAGKSIDLFPEYLVPICTPELAKRMTPGNETNPFGDVPLLHTEPSTVDTGWLNWKRYCESNGFTDVDVEPVANFKFTTLAIRAMFAGHGVHLAQLSVVLEALHIGRLVAPLSSDHWVQTGYPYKLVSFDSERHFPIHDRFESWLATEAEHTRIEMERTLASHSCR